MSDFLRFLRGFLRFLRFFTFRGLGAAVAGAGLATAGVAAAPGFPVWETATVFFSLGGAGFSADGTATFG